MTIDQTLAERGKTYGPFLDKAKTVQALIDVVIHEPGWERLAADQKQCIMVCFDKFARAIHGDPNHRDNFHDVVGYAKLVDDRMAADEALLAEYERGKASERPIPEDWKVWLGGTCPVHPESYVNYQMRRGTRTTIGEKAGLLNWAHGAVPNRSDIVAYCISETPSRPMPMGGGWLLWGGGNCPVDEGTPIEVEYRNGQQSLTVAQSVGWNHYGQEDDVVMYRLSRDT